PAGAQRLHLPAVGRGRHPVLGECGGRGRSDQPRIVLLRQLNSLHSRATLASPSSEWGNFYEADLYAGVKFSVLKTVEVKPYYIAYKYPGGAFATVQEVDLAFALNDAQWLDKWALNPTALIAWEFKNTALGLNEGTYAEVGIRPSYTIYDD